MNNVKDIVKEAAANGKYHFHKDLNGKLTGYIPKKGQLMVSEGFDLLAKVIKDPNSVKDFLIEYEDGSRERKNLVNKDIEGFIDVD